MFSYKGARGCWSVVFLIVGTALMVSVHGWMNTGLALAVNFGLASLICLIPFVREDYGWLNEVGYLMGGWMIAWGVFDVSPYWEGPDTGLSLMRIVFLATTLGTLSLISFLTTKAFDFKPVTQ